MIECCGAGGFGNRRKIGSAEQCIFRARACQRAGRAFTRGFPVPSHLFHCAMKYRLLSGSIQSLAGRRGNVRWTPVPGEKRVGSSGKGRIGRHPIPLSGVANAPCHVSKHGQYRRTENRPSHPTVRRHRHEGCNHEIGQHGDKYLVLSAQLHIQKVSAGNFPALRDLRNILRT